MNSINFTRWTATALIVAATTFRATGYSNLMDLILTMLGCGLWAVCGYVDNNKPLTVVNAFSVLVVAAGLMRYA